MIRILNTTDSEMSPEQISELDKVLQGQQFHVENMFDVAPERYASIVNAPGDLGELWRLAGEFANFIRGYDVVHLPIGSPAFQFIVYGLIAISATEAFPAYMFSHATETIESYQMPDGSVQPRRVSVFQNYVVFKTKTKTREDNPTLTQEATL